MRQRDLADVETQIDRERLMLTHSEIERITGLSHGEVSRLVNTPIRFGGIPCLRFGPRGTRVYVRRTDLERWLDTQQVSNR